MYADLLVYCRSPQRWPAAVDYARRLVEPGTGQVQLWAETTPPTADTLSRQAAWTDAVLLDGIDDLRQLRELVQAAARPCLLLPPGDAALASPRRIAVGWNGSLQARRALHAALPLLRAAQQVVLIEAADCAGTEQAQRFLRRHGVQPERADCGRHGAAGPRLLELCAAQTADLLVLGAYAERGLGEWDGAQTLLPILREHRLPLLLQH
jgi:nucleotide-binding universal stress UspA family protein